MRVLLDENVPHPLMRFLVGHEVSAVQACGLRGVYNGKLLEIAEESFDVFILADKNMRYQQRVDGRNIAIGRREALALIPDLLSGRVDSSTLSSCITFSRNQ